MKSFVTTIGLALGLSILNHGVANASATLTHLYELEGNLNDSFGALLMDSNPNGTIDSSGYTFDANEGLTLSNGVNPFDYSILLDFSFDNTSGYRKIIDYKNLGSDTGLYNLNRNVNFYNTGGSSTRPFTRNVMSRLIITREDATDLLTVYVDGIQQHQFTDSRNIGVFDQTDNIARFFVDDNRTNQREASSGLVDTIAIWDGALLTSEVTSLGTSGTSITTATTIESSPILGLLTIGGIFSISKLNKKLRPNLSR